MPFDSPGPLVVIRSPRGICYGALMDPLGVPMKIISTFYVSRLILLPNLAYNSTLSCVISSLIVLSFSSTNITSSSMFSVDFVRSSCTSGSGNEMNESPIL